MSKTTELTFTSVENKFLGVSITERDRITMRRLSIEVHDLARLRQMRECLDDLIKAVESK